MSEIEYAGDKNVSFTRHFLLYPVLGKEKKESDVSATKLLCSLRAVNQNDVGMLIL